MHRELAYKIRVWRRLYKVYKGWMCCTWAKKWSVQEFKGFWEYQSCARQDIYLHPKYLHLWHRVKDYMSSIKQDGCQSGHSITSKTWGSVEDFDYTANSMNNWTRNERVSKLRTTQIDKQKWGVQLHSQSAGPLLGVQSAKTCEDKVVKIQINFIHPPVCLETWMKLESIYVTSQLSQLLYILSGRANFSLQIQETKTPAVDPGLPLCQHLHGNDWLSPMQIDSVWVLSINGFRTKPEKIHSVNRWCLP